MKRLQYEATRTCLAEFDRIEPQKKHLPVVVFGSKG